MTKDDLRELSCDWDIPIAKKPSQACLSSRIQYGEGITQEKLEMIEKAEDYLLELGFRQVRVRLHGAVARIEVEQGQFDLLMANRNKVINRLRDLGFTFVTLDLGGYKSGSMDLMHTEG